MIVSQFYLELTIPFSLSQVIYSNLQTGRSPSFKEQDHPPLTGEYYGSIHLDYFYTYYFILGLHDQIYFQNTLKEKTQMRIYFEYQEQAQNMRTI